MALGFFNGALFLQFNVHQIFTRLGLNFRQLRSVDIFGNLENVRFCTSKTYTRKSINDKDGLIFANDSKNKSQSKFCFTVPRHKLEPIKK